MLRKTAQSKLSPRAKALITSQHRQLNPPKDTLTEKSQKRPGRAAKLLPLLRSVWEWKEAFSIGYNCPPNHEVASLEFDRWYTQGD